MISNCLRPLSIQTSSSQVVSRWVHDVDCACAWLTESGSDVLAFLVASRAVHHSEVSLNMNPHKELPCTHACTWIPCPTCRKHIIARPDSWNLWKGRLRQFLTYETFETTWNGRGMLRGGALLMVKASVTRTLMVMKAAEVVHGVGESA